MKIFGYQLSETFKLIMSSKKANLFIRAADINSGVELILSWLAKIEQRKINLIRFNKQHYPLQVSLLLHKRGTHNIRREFCEGQANLIYLMQNRGLPSILVWPQRLWSNAIKENLPRKCLRHLNILFDKYVWSGINFEMTDRFQ